ncbi:MAG: exodeoxyribonuclease VII small subunit [Chloroflexota bacterium]
MAKSKKKINIEERLHRIELIAEELDNGQIPLEEMIELYEEAVKLSKECREYLNEAEQKIITISGSAEDDEGIADFV